MEINRWSLEGKRSGKPLSRPDMWDVMGVSESPINSYELVVYNCTCFDLFMAIRGYGLCFFCAYFGFEPDKKLKNFRALELIRN